MVLSDIEIERRLQLPAGDPQRLVIEPFVQHTRPPGHPSYGLQSFGYDVRLGRNFKFPVYQSTPVSPSNPPQYDHIETDSYIVLNSGLSVLAVTYELIEMPRDCTAFIKCKSTWARLFINLNTTPLEAGWRGFVTIEIVNLSRIPVELLPGDGIGQVVFLRGDQPCRRPYSGPYQDQAGVTPPRVGG